jgi:hypothetical protein
MPLIAIDDHIPTLSQRVDSGAVLEAANLRNLVGRHVLAAASAEQV